MYGIESHTKLVSKVKKGQLAARRAEANATCLIPVLDGRKRKTKRVYRVIPLPPYKGVAGKKFIA